MSEHIPTLLIVDDEPFNVDILLEYLEHSGYSVETAFDGQTAWEMLEAGPEHFDVVILDRMMPRMNGMQVLDRIKHHPVLQSMPVILQTALASKEEILEGLQAGAYYYLTKPFEEEMLLTVLNTAVEDRMRYRRVLQESDVASRTFGMMREAKFCFQSLAAARDLATVLANAFPDPRRVAIGLAELLVNAVEHGNLGITYEEKSRLREQDLWEVEIDKRLADPANAGKLVKVQYCREGERIRVVISDEGEGFNWQDYLEMDPARAFDTHGRGIAMSRMISFDTIEYRHGGSEVEVSVSLAEQQPSAADASEAKAAAPASSLAS